MVELVNGIHFDDVASSEENILYIDAVEFADKTDETYTLVGYISDDDVGSYVLKKDNGWEFSEGISECNKDLFNLEPDLFGYPVYFKKYNDMYIYVCNGTYTISRNELDISDIGGI